MRYSILILTLLIAGCASQESANKSVGYFDIETYIKELPEWVITQAEVKKTVKLNDQVESETIRDYSILPELNMMNKYNINKPALGGKYKEEKKDNKTIYEAIDEDLITRTLTIERNGDVVSRIEIEGLQKSILSESRQTIIFEPNKSFFLRSDDVNRYTKDIAKEVLIEY